MADDESEILKGVEGITGSMSIFWTQKS